mmetsp:Transcript_4546/g.6342  ORF Transcript_4546/g.6342 Transcript_4546/m.6342 type:complete len:201 (-) Transcript_4546:171-773(-)|eukprot:CAMPEP_0194092654 /NCGR_PEP_ID=MMETSP0149-20130528/47540_1 /TAXON_ID=122233 /ORGANISM="Chaetoceros debilis, Strain MM31A-1" /LENGTH=200 /DNA_ID=CAMNT_0038777673 /DNA_START=128 /DNA_END=730 /DNA_ORIENTATION=+
MLSSSSSSISRALRTLVARPNVTRMGISTEFSSNPIIIEDDTSSGSGAPASLLRKKASIRRTFTANSNAQAMLICGGESLAAHASFDPNYSQARKYIRNHAVGPAIISPLLTTGLMHALVEATFPQSIFVKNEVRQLQPLIVGVEVEASMEVESVMKGGDAQSHLGKCRGYELEVKTSAKRLLDGVIISEGAQTIWLPDY